MQQFKRGNLSAWIILIFFVVSAACILLVVPLFLLPMRGGAAAEPPTPPPAGYNTQPTVISAEPGEFPTSPPTVLAAQPTPLPATPAIQPTPLPDILPSPPPATPNVPPPPPATPDIQPTPLPDILPSPPPDTSAIQPTPPPDTSAILPTSTPSDQGDPPPFIPVTGGGAPNAEDMLRAQSEQLNAQLFDTQLAYNPPDTISVGETIPIDVGLLLLVDQTSEQANQQLSTDLEIPQENLEVVTIQTASFVKAELKGDQTAFKIEQQHINPQQPLIVGLTTEWHWRVTALKPGNHTLTLVLSSEFQLNGKAIQQDGPTYVREIDVHVDPAITGKYLLGEYWVQLVAFGLASTGVGGYFGMRQLLFRRMKRSLLETLDVEPPGTGKGHFFMSYSRRDERFVIPLARDLIDEGIPIWIDQLEITAGENWKEELQNGINGTDAIMVVLSQDSIDSPYVQAEIAMSIKANKPFFAVQHKTFTLDNLRKLQSTGTQLLSSEEVAQVIEKVDSTNFIDFSKDYPTGLERLIKDLKRSD